MTPDLKKVNLITAWMAVGIILYTGYRAFHLSITHDEAFTYTRYVHHTYGEIITYHTGDILPNNHVLNTISQKFFSRIFGPEEFALRIGTWMASIVFVLVSRSFSGLFEGWQAVSVFLILTMHPYVLDFMSLSRGYGFGYAGIMLSLFYFLKSVRQQFDMKNFALALLAGIFAVWSNFSLLNYFLVAGFAFLVLHVFYNLKYAPPVETQKPGKLILIWVVSILILAALMYEPIRIILSRKQLFGGESGFWVDTVNSLCNRLAYGAAYAQGFIWFLKILIIAVLLASILHIVNVFRVRKPSEKDLSLIYAFLVLSGMVMASILQFHLMDSYYPMERLAISFMPPFLLMMVLLYMSFISGISFHPGVLKYILPALALIFTFHFLLSANFSYVLDWKYDANTREIAMDIESMDQDVLVGAHPLFEPALNFYKSTVPLSGYPPIHRDGYRYQDAYQVFVIPDEDRQKVVNDSLILIKEYLPSHTILARKSGN